MCDKCDQIDQTVVRFYQLKERLSDQRMNDALDGVIAEFESQKRTLHIPRDRSPVQSDGELSHFQHPY
jgi:hypothetical protein